MAPFTLTALDLHPGQSATVAHIADAAMAMLALRFGMGEGAEITLLHRIPNGPMVFRYGHGELALGRDICRSMTVQINQLYTPHSDASSTLQLA